MKLNDGHGKVKVVDENGREGTASYHGGYVMGGSYVNPYWTIRWNSDRNA